MELRERSNGKGIIVLKKGISKLREAHFKEIHSLGVKLKKLEDKCSAKAEEWKVKEKSFQDKVALLEAKAWE